MIITAATEDPITRDSNEVARSKGVKLCAKNLIPYVTIPPIPTRAIKLSKKTSLKGMKVERYKKEATVYKIKNRRVVTKVFINSTPKTTNLF